MIDPRHPDYQDTPVSPLCARFDYAPVDASAPPYVSVITPYFNTGAIFEETAACMFRQSLQQWEWIIVNDGSRDGAALEVLDRFRNRDPRIRVIDLPANRGPSAARNHGVAQARSGIVFYLDGDDLIEPTTLEKGAWFLNTNPEFAFVNSWSLGFGAREYLWQIGFERREQFLEVNLATIEVFVRRAAHRAIGGFDESLRDGMEDWEYWLRMAETGLWGDTIPEFLTWYRRRLDHGDRWVELSADWRATEFKKRFAAQFPRLTAGQFPSPAARAPQPFDTPRPPVEAFNLLAKTRPRLLLIAPWTEMGGADKFNLDLLAQLGKRGWECTVATTREAENRWTNAFSHETPDIFHLPNFVKLADQPAFLVHLIRSRRPDVVMVSNSELGYWLLPYLRAHCPEPAYVDYVHMEQEDWKNGGYGRYSLGSADQVELTIVASQHLRDWMVKRGGRADHIEVCHINVDAEYWRSDEPLRLAARTALGISPDEPVIAFTGRLCEQKQPKVLAHTFRELAREQLRFTALIGGDGPDEGWLREFAAAQGLSSRVRLMGALPSGQVRELYRAADIFFLPSQWEGIALSIYEAMAGGLPIVGADVGGQRELVTPACGYLLPRTGFETEVRQYAGVLKTLLRDADLRRRLGSAGRKRIEEVFSLDAMGTRMVELFAVARERGSSAARPRLPLSMANELAARAIEFARLERGFDKHWIESAAVKASYDDLRARFAALEQRLDELHDWTRQEPAAPPSGGPAAEALSAVQFSDNGSAWRKLQRDYRRLHEWNLTVTARHDDAQKRLQLLESELNGIRNSTGWRILQLMYRCRHAVFPRGSRREALAKRCMQAARRLRRRTAPLAPLAPAAKSTARALAESNALCGADVPGLVSVVLPVFNQADLLDAAVASVLAQTYTELELIIVDDGSTDDIDSVLMRHAGHPRVRILRQKNQKLPAALNHGFAFARGEFRTWTSADNLMEPAQLEKQVAFLRANPTAAMVYCDYTAIDDRGQPLRDPNWRAHNRSGPDSAEIHLPRSTQQLNSVEDNFIGPCFMYRASAARLVGDYAPRMGYEDYDYWMRMNTFFPVRHLGSSQPLYRYRVHDNTLSARAGELRIQEGVRNLLQYEAQRQETYRHPWLILADEPVRSRLAGVKMHPHTVEACGAPSAAAAPETKRLLLLSEKSLHRPGPAGEKDVACAWLGSEAIEVYRNRIPLSQFADVCLVPDSRIAQRAALFCDRVVQYSSPQEGLRLALAGAENLREFHLRYGNELAQRCPPACADGRSQRHVLLQLDSFAQGGLEQVVLDLAVVLQRCDWRVTVLVLKHEGLAADRAREAGIDVLTAPPENFADFYREFLRGQRVDLVNAHFTLHGAAIARELGIPFVQTIHNAYAWMSQASVDEFRRADEFTTAYLCVSANCALYADLRMGLPVSKMVVTPNGVDTQTRLDQDARDHARRTLRARFEFGDESFVFLNVASIYPPKAQLAAVRALARVRKECRAARLLFLGRTMDEAYERQVRGEIERLGLQSAVTFAGFDAEPQRFFAAADAFLLPSFWEGWSLALAEAALAGLPLVASDVGAAREMIHSVGGALVSPPFEHAAQLTDATIGRYLSCEDAGFSDGLARAMIQTCQDPRPPLISSALRARLSREHAYGMYDQVFRWLLSGGDPVAARVWTREFSDTDCGPKPAAGAARRVMA